MPEHLKNFHQHFLQLCRNLQSCTKWDSVMLLFNVFVSNSCLFGNVNLLLVNFICITKHRFLYTSKYLLQCILWTHLSVVLYDTFRTCSKATGNKNLGRQKVVTVIYKYGQEWIHQMWEMYTFDKCHLNAISFWPVYHTMHFRSKIIALVKQIRTIISEYWKLV